MECLIPRKAIPLAFLVSDSIPVSPCASILFHQHSSKQPLQSKACKTKIERKEMALKRKEKKGKKRHCDMEMMEERSRKEQED